MKATILVLTLFLTACGGGSQSQPVIDVCAAVPLASVGIAQNNADADKFRVKFQAGQAVAIAVIGDSTTHGTGGSPNAMQLLNTYLQSINPSSVVYNEGVGGSKAVDHIEWGTIKTVAQLYPKPDAVVIALGINSATMRFTEQADLETLVAQVRSYGMLPILAKENNIACLDSSPTLHPNAYWQFTRSEVDAAGSNTKTDVIDLGTPDGVVDATLLSDHVHPDTAGYEIIFEHYKKWLLN